MHAFLKSLLLRSKILDSVSSPVGGAEYPVSMRTHLFATLLLPLILSATPSAGFSDSQGASPVINLGDIPDRPRAPELPFKRFFEISRIADIEFAPDNQAVYLLKNDGRVDNVFAIDLGDGLMRQITAYREPVAAFLVDRKGRYLITMQDVGGNGSYDLYRFALGTGQVLRLTSTGPPDKTMLCDVSPDGAFVYFAKSRHAQREADIYRANITSGETSIVLPGRGRMLDCEALSADGRQLIFGELLGTNGRHLGVLDLASGKARYIIREPGLNNLDGGFAGDAVYYRSAKDSDRFRLWQYEVGDKAPAPTPLPLDNDIESLSLQSEGRIAVIVYRTELTSRTALFRDGFTRQMESGLPPEDIIGAVFSRDDPELGIFITTNAAAPPRYYLARRNKVELLYDSNQSGIDNKFFSEARSLRIPSFDGLPIPTHLFIPNGTSADSPRPVIVWIHGGPDDHVDPLFMNRVQFLANRGFIVAAPNVRGSTGFGKAYSFLDNGDWGGGHIRDIVEVTESIRRLEFVDGNNIFIVGASFGGFSVMSVITQYPSVFKAAINVFGITELSTFVDSWPPYIQKLLFAELGFDPRRNVTRNRAISPLYHVDRVKIPLQVHQGANDIRVLRSQSDALVQRMRQLGLTVEYYVYPDEGHGFSRSENEEVAFTRMVAFLKRQMR